MTVVLSNPDFTQAGLTLSVVSIKRRTANVSFAADFTRYNYSSEFGIRRGLIKKKSHTETVFVPFRIKDINFVKFYSNSTHKSTFKFAGMIFDPIYMEFNWLREKYRKNFCPLDVDEMKHETWYPMDLTCL